MVSRQQTNKLASFSSFQKMASRFVPLDCEVDEFIEKQANQNTLSKTKRDLALFQEYLKARQVEKEVETIEPTELNELVSAFLVEVKKKDGQDSHDSQDT